MIARNYHEIVYLDLADMTKKLNLEPIDGEQAIRVASRFKRHKPVFSGINPFAIEVDGLRRALFCNSIDELRDLQAALKDEVRMFLIGAVITLLLKHT